MKKLVLYVCMALYISLTACEDDYTNEGIFNLSQTEFKDLSHEGEELSIEITAYDGWVATSQVDWCKLSDTEGRGESTLRITVSPNIEQDRTGIIELRTQRETRTISISQKALPAGSELHYKLPIVIHVIYDDPSDPRQNPDGKYLQDVIAGVNRAYKGIGENSSNMNLEFVPATTDPQGNLMPEPGIDRVQWVSSTMEMTDVMFSNERKYNHFLWDPNEYVNVLLYTFDTSTDPTMGNVMGVSTFPYSPSSNPMEGTETVPYSHLKLENLKFAYCVSINNIYVTSANYLFPEFGELDAQQLSIQNTLTHELGHYLGLRHVFSESEQLACADTDYCDDTKSYNKTEYEYTLSDLAEQWQNDPSFRTEENFKKAFQRTCCDNSTFEAHNIMDYAYCYSDEFTAEQRMRVRHVLEYSPLIPGPKKGRAANTRVAEGTIDLPITVMCAPQKAR